MIKEFFNKIKFRLGLPKVQHLSKDNLNVVYIYVGKMPKCKVEEHIKNLSVKFKQFDEKNEYKICWLPYR